MRQASSIVWWALLGITAAWTGNAAVLLDRALTIGIERTNQNVRLNWFGSNGVPYQVESSTNFAWTNASGVITGAGANLFFTTPMAAPGHVFYRIRKIAVPVISASFTPGTGVLTVIGDDFDNTITVGRSVGGILTVNGGSVPITGGIATTANTIRIEVFGRGGNDSLSIDQAGGAMPAAHLFGEGGDDTLTGSSAVDELSGGPGNDTLVGRGGSDLVFGNDDDDILFWSAGDGEDVVEGGAGHDRLAFNGNATAETLTFSANGARLRATREFDSGVTALDVNGVERVDCNPLQGADGVVISNLVATAVTQLNVNLGAFLSGTKGDAASDIIVLNGPTNANVFNLSANAGAVEASGLGALVRVLNGELAFDGIDIPGFGGDVVNVNGSDLDDAMSVIANGPEARVDVTGFTVPVNVSGALSLVVNGLGGADTISCVGNLAALVPITLDGGDGDDTIRGSNGADLLLGGNGADFIDGQQGNDVAFGGAHDDTFQWDPGDGSDVLEGQGGSDTLVFNGSNAAEIMEASANGSRLRFTRNLGNIIMDVDGVELLNVNTLGSADIVSVTNLVGTALATLHINLAGVLGTTNGDALADTVLVNGTAGDDILTATLVAGRVVVSGLDVTVSVEHFETALDSVRLQGLGGQDVLDASAAGVGAPPFILDGGPGEDILLGSAANDILFGGDDDDVIFGGPGVDTLDGGAGDNVAIPDGFSVAGNVVSIFGDGADNTITVSRDAGGNLFSNGVAIAGANIGNTALIRVFGRAGNDTLAFDETSGALPAALIVGGGGLDTVIGSSGPDLLFGGVDNDSLLGRGGSDLAFGNSGDDTLTGGDANDQLFGQSGADLFVWNPGDDTDLNEGGADIDSVEVNGGNGAEQFTLTANGPRVRFDRLVPAPFSLDIGTCEEFVLNANGGTDDFSATGNLAALIQITVDGGDGNDTIRGSNGADLLLGGNGNDFIDGQQGNDIVFGGGDDDTFQWDPGDGSDVLEGQGGSDTLVFNGSNGAEIMEASANGSRLRFTRNLGNIVMDVDGVELLNVNMFGSADVFLANNVAGTDLARIDVDLAVAGGGSDGQIDIVTLNSTAAPETFHLSATNGVVEAQGLGALVRVLNGTLTNDFLSITGVGGDTVNFNGSSTNDIMTVIANGTNAQAHANGYTVPVNVRGALTLVMNGLDGPDQISCTGNIAALVPVTIDGGDGNDTLLGSNGADLLLGGTGNDFIDGQQGNDVAFGGGDNDTFQWDPGDGSDTLEGQDGTDTLVFNGSNGAEIMEASANGARLRFTRNIGSIVMDVDGVELVDVNALGGADNIIVNSLAPTDVTGMNLSLAGTLGGGSGDAQLDSITVNGTAAADTFSAAAILGQINVGGITPSITIRSSEVLNDSLVLNGLGGVDLFNIGPGVALLIGVTTNQ